MSPLFGFAAFAIALSAAWWLGRTSPTVRARLRGLYQDDRFPIILRGGIPVAPLWALAILGFGLLGTLPRNLAAILSLPALDFVLFLIALAFKHPPPFAPKWIRDDLESGVLQAPRPTRGDWALLGGFALFTIAGNFAIIWLVLHS